MSGASGDQILGHLARVAPFASLPSDAREELARSATIVALGRGDWFFRKGKPTDACYIVLRGSLDVVDGGDDTGEVLRVLLADSVPQTEPLPAGRGRRSLGQDQPGQPCVPCDQGGDSIGLRHSP